MCQWCQTDSDTTFTSHKSRWWNWKRKEGGDKHIDQPVPRWHLSWICWPVRHSVLSVIRKNMSCSTLHQGNCLRFVYNLCFLFLSLSTLSLSLSLPLSGWSKMVQNLAILSPYTILTIIKRKQNHSRLLCIWRCHMATKHTQPDQPVCCLPITMSVKLIILDEVERDTDSPKTNLDGPWSSTYHLPSSHKLWSICWLGCGRYIS